MRGVIAGFDHFTPAYDAACDAVKVAGYPMRVELANALRFGVLAILDAGYRHAHTLERAGSPLCTCEPEDNPPTNPATKARMDHHCDCAAVETAATLLGAYSRTAHAAQCIHGTEMDEFYTERS